MAEILRISATGPDGAGKDTAWRIAKQYLPGNLKILKIGKPSSYIFQGEEVYVDEGISKFLDALHIWADSRRNRALTSAANTLYVMFQWRIQESFWAKKIKPDLIFSLRDAYADPAAYAPYYMPNTLGKLEIPERIDALKLMHGSPFRDLTLFLDVDPSVAVTRIQQRIQREALDSTGIVRPKWEHQHENVKDLTSIRNEFKQVLGHLTDLRGTNVNLIDTTNTEKGKVGYQLAMGIMSAID